MARRIIKEKTLYRHLIPNVLSDYSNKIENRCNIWPVN